MEGFPSHSTVESLRLQKGERLIVLRGRYLLPGDEVEFLRQSRRSPEKVVVRRVSDGQKAVKDLTTLTLPSRYKNLKQSPSYQGEVAEKRMPTNLKQKFTKFVREIGLDDKDKLAVESGLEDPAGVPTDFGLDMALRLLYREQRDELIQLVKDAKKAAKKEKEEEDEEDGDEA